MQLRMSKKIAQLTKVIYHLNSKSEDHDLELQEMAEQYELEIEQILKDTTEKIDFFKLQMEEARDERRLHEFARVRQHAHLQILSTASNVHLSIMCCIALHCAVSNEAMSLV